MVTLELSFGKHHTEFLEFLEWYTHRAGSSWNDDQISHDGNGNFKITGTAYELYALGYDWAWQQAKGL